MGSPRLSIDVQLDTTGENYVKSRSNIAYEAINGTIRVKIGWSDDLGQSFFHPSDVGNLTQVIVVGMFLVSLAEVSLEIAKSKEGKYIVHLEGTPLQFSIAVENESILIQLVEDVDYANRERVIGSATSSRSEFLSIAANLIAKFNSEIVAANHSLADHPVVKSLEAEVRRIREVS